MTKKILTILIIIFSVKTIYCQTEIKSIGDYKIIVKGKYTDGGSKCGNYRGLTSIKVDEKRVYHKKYSEGTTAYYASYSFDGNKPREIFFYYSRRFRNGIFDCKERATSKKVKLPYFPLQGGFFSKSYSKEKIYDGAIDSGHATIQIYETPKTIHDIPKSICDDQILTLRTKEPYKGLVKWELKGPSTGNEWKDIKRVSGNTVNINFKDHIRKSFFGASINDYGQYWFRAKRSYGNVTYYSNEKETNIKPSPLVNSKNITHKITGCGNNVVLTFQGKTSRKLLSGEKFTFYVYKNGNENLQVTGELDLKSYSSKFEYKIKGSENNLNKAIYTIKPISKINNNAITTCDKTLYTKSIDFPKKLIIGSPRSIKDACYGSSNGEYQLNFSGGTPPYKYRIGYTTSGLFSSSPITISNLSKGRKTVVIEDSRGCTVEQSILVKETPKVTFRVAKLAELSTPKSNDAKVEISFTSPAISASEPLSYVLTNTDTNIKSSGKFTSTKNVISNLSGGNYKIQLIDKNNCSQTYSAFKITKPLPLVLSTSISTPNCHGGKGKLGVYGSGGYKNYTVTVRDNNSSFWKTKTFSNSASFDLDVGSYKVTLKDAKGVASAEKNVVINNQSKVSITLKSSPIKCFGQTSIVSVIATGGKSNSYQYGIYQRGSIKWQNYNLFSLPKSNIPYRLVAKDQVHGCISDIVELDLSSAPSSKLEISNITVVNNKVYGGRNGSISIKIRGGVPPYEIKWSRNYPYQSLNSTYNYVTGLSAGYYSVAVYDKAGCIAYKPVIRILENPKLTVNINPIKTINCYGDKGVLKVELGGGSGRYTYQWYKNNVLLSQNSNQSTINNLGPGTYRVNVNDGYVSTSKSITLYEPLPLKVVSATKTDVSCYGKNDGTIKLNIKGGTTGYLYSIDDKNTYQNLVNSTITDLDKGIYKVWIKDSNGCETSYNENLKIESPTEIKIDTSTITHCTSIGGTDGFITMDSSGGEGTHTYNWTKIGDVSFNKTTQNITNISKGKYILRITDGISCSIEKEFEVLEPLPLKVKIEPTGKILCFGDKTGGLKAKVSGGFPIFSIPTDFDYQWYYLENGTSTVLNTDLKVTEVKNLKTGRYKVVVTDSKGSVASSLFDVQQPDKLQISLVTKTDVSCYGGNNGSIDVAVTGGSGMYSYYWYKTQDNSYSSNTEDIDNLTNGTYKLLVRDTNGCELETSGIQITQPNLPIGLLDFTVVNLKGFQTKDGAIKINPQGGTPPYNFTWAKNDSTTIMATSAEIASLTIGTYTLTIADSKNCSFTQSFILTEPKPLEIEKIEQFNAPLCFGEKVVTLKASGVDGGVKPYVFNWYLKGSTTSISSTNTINNLGAGTYVFEVVDANQIKTTKEYEVVQPSILKINLISKQDIQCNAENTGTIDVKASGGVPPYSYSWSNSTLGEHVEKLSAGTYTVKVVDKNLCETSKEIVIKQPEPITLNKQKLRGPTGAGLSNGLISIELKGGTIPYQYQWKDSNGISLGTNKPELLNIKKGDYSVTILDKNNCQKTFKFHIEEPKPIVISINQQAISCFGETSTITANITGGVKPYRYQWYNQQGSAIGDSNTIHVKAGTYSFKMKDTYDNVKEIKNIVLTEPNLLQVDTDTKVDVLCYAGNSGSIEILAKGGTPPYSYSWSHGVSGNKIENLTAGTYTVNVTDNNLCSFVKTYQVNEPQKYDVIQTKISRPKYKGGNDGSIEVLITGGSPTYNYIWEDESGKVISQESSTILSSKVNNLSDGIYFLTIEDAKGCVIKKKYNFASPGELLASIKLVQSITCFNGNNAILEAVTKGGVGGNTFKWYRASNNSNILSTKQQLSNISYGEYYVVVNNAEGIEEKSSIFTVNQPEQIQVNTFSKPVSCYNGNDGAITIRLNDRNGSYYYRYKTETGSFLPWKVISSDNKAKITGLKVGKYIVQIKDDKNCLAKNESQETEFVFEIKQPKAISIKNTTIVNASGFGLSNGKIKFTVVGGTQPYQYILNKKDTDTSKKGAAKQSFIEIDYLNAGEYHVTLTDKLGCVFQKDFEVKQPEKLAVFIKSTANISCSKSKDGMLTASVSGGVEGYTYAWYTQEDGTAIISTEKDLEKLSAATYYVIVKDANQNRVRSENFVFTAPKELTVSLETDYKSCGQGADWEVISRVQGGTEPYRYLWDTGEITSTLSDVEMGTYKVTVVDAYGCKKQASLTITPPPPIEVSNNEITNPTCYRGADGKIVLQIKGGVAPYTYQWSNGMDSSTITGLTSGEYSVRIQDSKGCFLETSYTITDPEELFLELEDKITLCKGQKYILDASVDFGAQYFWSADNGFTSTEPIIEISKPGIYTIKVITKLGCEVMDKVVVKQSPVSIDSNFILSSQAYANQSFVMVNVSGSKNDTVTWLLPENAQIVSQNNDYCEIILKEQGNYEITLVTELGECKAFQTKNIVVSKKSILDTDSNDTLNSQIIESIILYPNPSFGKFTIDVKLKKVSDIQLKFYKLNGTMWHQAKHTGSAVYDLKYDFKLQAGVYFVLLETKSERILKKILIQ